MSFRKFPEEPWQRKAILVVSQHDIQKCTYEDDGDAILLNDEVFPLAFPVQDGNPIARTLARSNLARPGVLLLQNPYDQDSYEDALDASRRFALAKFTVFSQLCMHLGARLVSVKSVEVKTTNMKNEFAIGAGYHGVDGKAKVAFDAYERLKAEMSLEDRFVGGPADIPRAQELLSRTALSADPVARSLVEMRKVSLNRLTQRTLTLDLSSETRRTIEVATSVKVPKFIKLQADYKRVASEHVDYTVKLDVLF
jgi:hypothetical protein